MKLKSLAILCCTSLLLSACMQGLMGEVWNDAKSYESTTEQVDTDTIRAFGFSKPDSKLMEPNRLVMLGDKFVYVTRVEPDNDLVKALRTTDLSQPFRFGSDEQPNNQILRVNKSPNANNFVAYTELTEQYRNLCLHYVVNKNLPEKVQQQEIKKLEALNFRNTGRHYLNCYERVHGEIFSSSAAIPAEYRFETGFPVRLYVRYDKANLNAGGMLKGIVLTPFASMGDVLLSPLYGALKNAHP